MTTWLTLLADIRADTKDTGSTPRWPDATLFIYLKDAIRDYSQWFPRRVDRASLTISSGSYPLPVDFIEVLFVESPEDYFLEQRIPRPGVRFPTKSGRPFHYYIEGSNLYLEGTPLAADEILLTYNAIHTIPTSETDTAHIFTFPNTDEELIRLFIKAKAHEQMRERTAALDRFKQRNTAGNTRQDNPLIPVVEEIMSQYHEKIAYRVGGRAVKLYRPGRTR